MLKPCKLFHLNYLTAYKITILPPSAHNKILFQINKYILCIYTREGDKDISRYIGINIDIDR